MDLKIAKYSFNARATNRRDALLSFALPIVLKRHGQGRPNANRIVNAPQIGGGEHYSKLKAKRGGACWGEHKEGHILYHCIQGKVYMKGPIRRPIKELRNQGLAKVVLRSANHF